MFRNNTLIRRTISTAAALAGLGLAGGCGAHGHDAVAQAVSAEAPGAHDGMASHEMPAAATAAGTLPDALNFSAETIGGEAFEGSSVAGKSAVFWFWAPGCMDCVREAPNVVAAQKAFTHAVTFVGVSGLGKPAAMASAVDQMKVGGFTQVADVDGAVWKRFGVAAQPAYAFIDSTGHVEVVKGALGAKGLKARVARLAEM